MFQMYPGALDGEMQRRRELAFSTMHGARGVAARRQRVAGVTQFRHVIAALAAAVLAPAR
jgi:hypothetical protein